MLDIKGIQSLLDNGAEQGEQYIWAISPEGLMSNEKSAELAAELGLTPADPIAQWNEILSGREMAVTTASSGQTDWTLLSAIPMSSYMAELNSIRSMYVLLTIVCIGLGLAVSVLLTYRNYRPVKRLSEMAEQPGRSRLGDKSEFDYIAEALGRLIENEAQYEKEVKRQRELLRQNSLTKMLRGNFYSAQAFDAACADYEIHFSTDTFAAVCVDLEDYDNSLFQQNAKDEADDAAELAFMVTGSLLETYLREYCDCYYCRTDGFIYCVLSPKTGTDGGDFTAAVEDICRRAAVTLRERFSTLLTVYVSGGYSGKNRAVHEAYQETVWGMEQMKGYLMTGKMMNREKLHREMGEDASLSPPSVSMWRGLHSAVVSGDFDTADNMLQTLLRDGVASLDQTFSNVRLRGIFIMDYLITNIDKKKAADNAQELTACLTDLKNVRDMDELKGIMNGLFRRLYEISGESGGKQDAVSLGREAVRYINENYADPNLSVASIADHFQFSKSYLLRIFKREENGGVLDYIHQRRVEQAKQLLRESESTVNDVAQKVGYTNGLALIRAFKRSEGVTPTAYREMSRLTQNNTF